MARLARFMLLAIGIAIAPVAILSLLYTSNSSSGTVRNVWGSKQEAIRLVGGQVPSVPGNVSAGTDVGRSSEPTIPRQPSTTVVSNETVTVTPASLLTIHLVVVMFRSISNETKSILREQEHSTVLQRNLNHSLITTVHIMTGDKVGMEEYLRGLDLPNRHKLVVVESEEWDTMRGVFQYISDNLADKDVMYANGDIYLGNGFEKVDASALSKRHIFYALTRLGKQEEACKMEDFCGGDLQYIGAHDAFLFHLKEPIPEEALKELEFKIWDYGAENVLIGVFNKLLHYCTLNPCKILEIYHLHCSGARRLDRVRINNKNKFSALAHFTNELNCQPPFQQSSISNGSEASIT